MGYKFNPFTGTLDLVGAAAGGTTVTVPVGTIVGWAKPLTGTPALATGG